MIDLKERLCFYCRRDNENDEANNILWPAVVYKNLEEYFLHLQDEMSVEVKSKIALDMISSHRTGGRDVTILRPLGNKSLLEYVKSVEGKNEYHDYTLSICCTLPQHGDNPNDFTSDQEYLEFMDALGESEEILRGPERPSNEPSWREYGLRILRQRESRNLSGQAASVNNDINMAEANIAEDREDSGTEKEIRAIDFQEAATPKNYAQASPATATPVAAKPAASQDTHMTEASEPVSEEFETDSHSIEMEEDASCAVSEAPVLTQTSDVNVAARTPRRHNHSSSSATVVSTDTYDDHSTVASEGHTPTRQDPWPFVQPALNESMNAKDIQFQLTMVGWETMVIGKKKFHTFPGVDMNNFKPGKNAFLLENLVNFVKKNNYFRNRQEFFSPSSEAKPVETPHKVARKIDGEHEQEDPPVSPMHPAPIPKRSNKTQSKPSTNKQPKKARATKKGTTSPKHQRGPHRQPQAMKSSRRSPRGSSLVTPVKPKQLTSDPFYKFSDLIKILRKKFGWKYHGGSLESNWLYVRGDSELGKTGKHGDDYFQEEWEVVEYCLKHNYKQKYECLEKQQQEEDEEEKTAENVAEDPNFKTPPPTRRMVGASQ
ncbi:unnamed protein product [Cylindrotheca closterium]|uniref:Uncharacterized protein n=1 Tax=Cylindrotheca closterium TaxID=2856 RepID=A0AAD2G2M6_9STRA|nr:unnamed protein product [Cylindrotheca closterium]